MLLGGSQEHEKNLKNANMSGATYLGHFPLQDFISLVDQCDLVVTQVTMALHIAIGLGKKIVLMNNIFNRHEFELYGLGEIVESPEQCGCYYSTNCPHESMRKILPDYVMNSIKRQINKVVL